METSKVLPKEEATAAAAARQALERVSAQILLCQRSIGMYPRSHPRVDAALRQIKEALESHVRETARRFHLDTEAILEEPDSREDPLDRRSRFVLAQALQLHLIESLSIAPEAPAEEIFELCFLLHEDFLRKAAEAGGGRHIDPLSWKSVELSFYTAEDLPVGARSIVNLIERAEGVHRLRDVEPAFKGLPEEVRAPVRELLMSGDFLRRTSRLRNDLRKRFPDDRTKDFDLITEALKTAIEPTEGARGKLTADEVVASVNDVLGFVEQNLDSLVNGIESLPVRAASPVVGEDVAETGHGHVAEDLGRLQEIKRRLAFLFRTGPREKRHGIVFREEALSDIRRSEAAPAAGARTEAIDDILSMRGLVFPPDTPVVAAANTRSEVQLLQVYLHLLGTESFRPTALGAWDSLVAHFRQAARQERDEVCREIASFLKGDPVPEVERFFDKVLLRTRRTDELRSLLERVVLPGGGGDLVVSFLARLSLLNPRQAVTLLCAFRFGDDATLKTLARARLLSLASDPTLLALWATEDPWCFLEPEVVEILRGLEPGQIRTAFRDFFSSAQPDTVEGVLWRLPANVPGVEEIILTAVDHGSPPVRVVALRYLGRYSTPRAFKALSEAVKVNNLRARPLLPEVRSALSALVEIDAPEAREFLAEVSQRRQWLVPVYKRAIRRALQEVIAAGQDERKEERG